MDDQETVERLDEDSVVRRDRGAGLAVVRVLLDEALRAGLVDRPRLLEVLNRLRYALLLEAGVRLVPGPSDTWGEAEPDAGHLAIPPRHDRDGTRDLRHTPHVFLPHPLHPSPPPPNPA